LKARPLQAWIGGGAEGKIQNHAKWDVDERASASLHFEQLEDLGWELPEGTKLPCRKRLILIGLISERLPALADSSITGSRGDSCVNESIHPA